MALEFLICPFKNLKDVFGDNISHVIYYFIHSTYIAVSDWTLIKLSNSVFLSLLIFRSSG